MFPTERTRPDREHAVLSTLGNSMTPLSFNLIVVFGLLLSFFVIGVAGFRTIRSYSDFFLRARTLDENEYSSSYVASTTSLATVMIFFFQFGPLDGIGILIAPLTTIAGVIFMAFLAKYMERDHVNETGTSLGPYIYSKFGSQFLSKSVSIIAIFGLSMILLIELYVGVTIFQLYLQQTSTAIPAGLFVISSVVFLYVSLGGFPGVVRTDAVQRYLIWFAAVLLLIVFLIDYADRPQATVNWLPHPLVGPGVLVLPYALLLNVLVVNLFLLPAHIRTWQMAASSRSIRTMRRGLLKGAIQVAVLWSLFAFIAMLFQALYPETEVTLVSMLEKLISEGGFFGRYIVFPALFVAALAALISTADSAILPITQSIIDDFLPQVRERLVIARLLILTGLFVIVLLYYLIVIMLAYNFISLLFTLFSIFIVLSPLVIFAMFTPPEVVRDKQASFWGAASVWGGLITALGMSYWGTRAAIQDVVLLGAPVGLVVGFLFLLPLWVRRANLKRIRS